jgi:hypothetical protein
MLTKDAFSFLECARHGYAVPLSEFNETCSLSLAWHRVQSLDPSNGNNLHNQDEPSSLSKVP